MPHLGNGVEQLKISYIALKNIWNDSLFGKHIPYKITILLPDIQPREFKVCAHTKTYKQTLKQSHLDKPIQMSHNR